MTDVIKKECLEISGQDAYRKIWSETNLGGSGVGRQGERWWGHADRIEAKKAKVSASGHEGKREGRWEVTYPSVFH